MIDIRGLSYIVTQIDALEKWRRYAEDVLGMMAIDAPDGSLHIAYTYFRQAIKYVRVTPEWVKESA